MLEFVNFAPKPIVNIEAVLFTGGPDQGGELVEWINANGGKASWVPADPGSHVRCGLKEHIKLQFGSAYRHVYVGDYVMQNATEGFVPLNERQVLAKYNRVNMPVAVLPIKTEYSQVAAA